MNGKEITIRSIQHYMYCPHRWGLIEIDKAWAENVFVTKANIMHDRVHSEDNHYTHRGRKVFTSVPVYNDLDEYNLYGVTDCIELTEDENGIAIQGSKEKYKICIVEYKPTQPKDCDYKEDDIMQVFAQKICVDYVFGGNCTAEIYYGNVKKRIGLPLNERFLEYDAKLKNMLAEMRERLDKGIIPPRQKGQKCSGCSMKDLCMPSVKKAFSVREEIKRLNKAALE